MSLAAAKRLTKTSKAANAGAIVNKFFAVYDTIEEIRTITGYVPRTLQQQMLDGELRFNVQVLHRRFGKTVMKVHKLIERALECPFSIGRYAYFAPTYTQAEDIAWHYMLEFTKDIPGRKVEQSKLAVWLPTRNGSTARIRLYGLDSPKQRVRGLYLDGAVFDEFAWIPMSAWAQQVRPMLSDRERQGVDRHGNPNQWCDFIFTPFGRNHAYTMFKNANIWQDGGAVVLADEVTGAREEVYRSDWSASLYKSSETGVIDADELASARIDQGPSKFDQEYECSFDAAVEGAIFARSIEEMRAQGRVRSMPWNSLLPVHTAWDLGMDDMTAIWFFQQVGREIRVIDYYENHGAGFGHYAEVLAARRYRYGYMLFPHDVEVREFSGEGKSRRAILMTHGIRATVVKRPGSKADSVAAGQSIFGRAVFDAEKCADGLDRLSLYRRQFNELLGVFSPEPVHDWASHGADAWQTLALGLKASEEERKPDGSRRPRQERAEM